MVLRVCLAVAISAVMIKQDQRAAQLLTQARQALGGEARLAKVQSLSAAGGSLRQMPDGGHAAQLKIDMQLPDRMLRTDANRGLGSDATFVMLRGINGQALLRNSKIINGGPGHRMSKPPLLGGTDAAALQSHARELMRFATAFLLTPPSVTATYAGEADSPDGKADVIEMKGANGFAVRVFLDKSTHLPLMMTYRDFDPRFIVLSRGGPPGVATSEERQVKDIAWYLEEHKPVSGLRMPHRISRSIAGEPDEEWTFSAFTFNPVFKADAFSDQ